MLPSAGVVPYDLNVPFCPTVQVYGRWVETSPGRMDGLDADELAAYFTPDGIWHNMPLEPREGQEVIREHLQDLPKRVKEFRIEILHQVSSGNVVMNERIDYMVLADRRVALPVAGIFELEDGKIKAWREYFDLGMLRGGQENVTS